jgi:hypothetical protein
MAGKSGATEWSVLLSETRHALSTLRSEDLERLAARGEQMLLATAGRDPGSSGDPGLGPTERHELAREHRLLGSLLAATDSNIEVLRRLRGVTCRRSDAGGIDSRWVR